MELSIVNCQLSIKKFRRGISLTEVLISMGVLTLGLLGVAAMFPVGSYYMLKADIFDRGSANAQAAFADLTGKGWLQQDAWIMDENNSFTSPLIASFKIYTTDPAYVNAPDAAMRSRRVTEKYGYAYVLDPLAIGSAARTLPMSASLGRFPICNRPVFNAVSATAPSWQHFMSTTTGAFPVRRVTFADPRGLAQNAPVIVPMDIRTVTSLFQSIDDLSLDLPKEKKLPGQNLLDSADLDRDGIQEPIARQSQGDYSWIATICPTTVQARDALLNQQPSHLYDVSVVVFFKRLLGTFSEMNNEEAIVRGHVVTTGTGGGELILNPECAPSVPANLSPDEGLKNLKVGQYVMVSGPHPESTAASPRLFLQWYRVMSIEEFAFDGNKDNPNVNEARVSLRGPDWPWQPAPGGLNDNTNISNDLRIGIFPGAVAVHTKTMKLSSGANSGSQWGAAVPVPPGYPQSPWIWF